MPSYSEIRQMWADLGVDLKRHDQYVGAFPQVFKEAILGQQNRPQAMDYFTDVVKRLHGARPWELYQHHQAGGKVVGTYCVYVPDELVYALGAVSTGLCGGDQFWVPAGQAVLPANTCALVASSLGSRLDRTSPFCQVADLYVGEATCDGKKKAWEILAQDVNLHVMDMPQKKRAKDVGRFAEEIVDLGGVLENLTGNTLTPERLALGIKLINGRRQALQRMQALRAHRPAPISGLDALLVVQVAFYDDPERFAIQLHRLCDELEERVARGEGVAPAAAKRILLTGSPMAAPNWKLHGIVERSGAVVVAEEMCTGSRYFENLVDESARDLDGMIQALAARYLKTNCACFTPNPGRMADIERLARDSQADGVIDYALQFCGLYSTEAHIVGQAMRDAGLPLLHIETDYSREDIERITTRVQAFLEMI
ncbi:MAG: double-cubane-cluster-containing anaerobic reductase [Pseudomonadota bacterium]